ncbi:MAG: hypothetical protein JSS22_02215 [Proteobacteria bacterium]|nr:hypothetical protein [Pseudomonadota bacterium]
MPDEYDIILRTTYDGLGLVESWPREADYLRARDFLKTLVGGPHGISRGRHPGAEIYEIATKAQFDHFVKFRIELKQARPEDRSRAMAQTDLDIYFDGTSMVIPFGTVENYRLASALALELTGPAGRTVSESGEIFYPETRDQLDALFALQRGLGVKRKG